MSDAFVAPLLPKERMYDLGKACNWKLFKLKPIFLIPIPRFVFSVQHHIYFLILTMLLQFIRLAEAKPKGDTENTSNAEQPSRTMITNSSSGIGHLGAVPVQGAVPKDAP
jgi:hypothetical protein